MADFVRGHTVVRVLKMLLNRPVDLLVTSLCAPLVDYMPGVRSSIVWDPPCGGPEADRSGDRIAPPKTMDRRWCCPGTWKAAIAPRWPGSRNECGILRRGPVRLVTECAGTRSRSACLSTRTPRWRCPPSQTAAAMAGADFGVLPGSRPAGGYGLGTRPAVALGPGSVGEFKCWTYYPEMLCAQRGLDVWVVGGPAEKTGAGNRRRRRHQGSRPHRHRPAQWGAGDGRRRRRDSND